MTQILMSELPRVARTDPQVTVLMSVYNGARFLQEAVDSVLHQTFDDFEFLIIDDGSTDASLKILQGFDDRRMRVISNGKNIGLTRSLNRGINAARGTYIARMDADDISLPERLAKQVCYLDEHPEVGLVASAYEAIDENGDALWVANPCLCPEGIYYQLAFCNFTVGPDVMFRKAVALRVGGYDEAFRRAQDYELWTQIARVARMDQLPEALIKYRLHANKISTRFNNEQWNDMTKISVSNLARLMGNEGCNFNALAPLRSFFYKGYQSSEKITYESLRALEKVEQQLIAQCPPSLDEGKLKEHCNTMLESYVEFMLYCAQVRDLALMLPNRRCRGAIINAAKSKIRRTLWHNPR
jgi:glycosyltransferase involved in cell wall biosynthesis